MASSPTPATTTSTSSTTRTRTMTARIRKNSGKLGILFVFYAAPVILSQVTAFVTPSVSSSSSASTSSSSSSLSSFNNNYGGGSSYSSTTAAPPQLDIDLNENAYRDIPTFDEWATTTCGIQRSDGVELYEDTSTTTSSSQVDPNHSNIGIRTTQDLQAGSPVLFVPSNVILSSHAAKAEIGTLTEAEQRLVSAKAADHVPQFYLFVKLLNELELGTQSPYYPWFNSLPRYYSNGSSMTPFCFECLPPLAGFLAQKERVQYIQFFQALKFVPFLNPSLTQNKLITKFVFAIVYTRGFPVPHIDGSTDYRLIPFMDYFNHGSDQYGPEVTVEYDEESNAYAYATQDIPAGSPLRLRYGDPTNPSHLLARYGFLDESSPATFCKIMITRPTQEQINMGYDHSRMLFFRETGEVSEEVWDVLLYELLGQQGDFNTQRQLYDAHMTGNYEYKQSLHQQYYSQTSQALLDHIDTFLQDLERLSQKGEGRNIEDHPRLPLILAHNQFVKETFLQVRSNLVGG